MLAGAITAACSSSADTLTLLGLTPEALQETASAETETAANPEEEKTTEADPALASATSGQENPDAENKAAASLFSRKSERTNDDSAKGSAPDETRTNVFASLFSAKKPDDVSENVAGENPATATTKPQNNTPDKKGRVAGNVDGEKTLTAELARQKAESNEDKEDTGERRSLLSAFFSPAGQSVTSASPVAEKAQEDESADTEEEKVQQVSARSSGEVNKKVQSLFGGDALPGVRNNDALFEIRRGSGSEGDGDIDLYEQSGSYQVASASGLARLAPNGLLKQRDSVDVSCFKPRLVRTLKAIEHHFGKRIVVTSGYRSPAYNKRVRGARRSLHMSCSAADIQISGVSKWELARFARSLPGRGGVGTYCHTRSVHVDVGPERDWNWSC